MLTIADCDDDAHNVIRARCLELEKIRLDSCECRHCRAGIGCNFNQQVLQVRVLELNSRNVGGAAAEKGLETTNFLE